VTSFDFADFLALADELAARPDEAAWRSAISRAYYAVLHVAFRALPPALQVSIPHRSTHQAVWNSYTTSSVRVCRQIGGAGIRLRNGRVDADYRAAVPITAIQTLRLMAHAHETMARLRRHGYQP
jgi:hypothetical protein